MRSTSLFSQSIRSSGLSDRGLRALERPDTQRGAPPNREMRKASLLGVWHSREVWQAPFRVVGLVGISMYDVTVK